MEEIEDPTERLKETMEAREDQFEKNMEEKSKWTLWVALSTSIIAVLAAIAGMLGNHHANEAMLEQIKSSDQWNYYQAKNIKAEVAGEAAVILTALGKPADSVQKSSQKEKDRSAEVKKTAEEFEKSADEHMNKHVVFSRSVTIFQIGIALSAISILTRKKAMWYVSLALCAAGIVFLVMGFFA
jgi:hypothetical protein